MPDRPVMSISELPNEERPPVKPPNMLPDESAVIDTLLVGNNCSSIVAHSVASAARK